MGYSLADEAASIGNLALLNKLIEDSNVGPFAIPNDAFCAAAIHGRTIIMDHLLEKYDITDNNEPYEFHVYLWLTSDDGHDGIIQMLLEYFDPETFGLDLNLPDAITGGLETITEILLERYPSYATSFWVLRRAVERTRNKSILEMLLHRASDITKVDTFGRATLYLAASNGNRQAVKLLLDKGIDVNARDRDGETALHGAVDCGDIPVVQCLLENGAQATSPGPNGESPLLWIARDSEAAMGSEKSESSLEAYCQVLGLLVANGADVNESVPCHRQMLIIITG